MISGIILAVVVVGIMIVVTMGWRGNGSGILSSVIGIGIVATVLLPMIPDVSDGVSVFDDSNMSDVGWLTDDIFVRAPIDPIVELCTERCHIYDYTYARSDSEGNCWCNGFRGEVFSGVVS